MASFNYNALAELYPPKSTRFRRAAIGYRRFDRAAEAIRFAMEKLAPELLSGAILEVDDLRLDAKAIRELYESDDYPLPRLAQG
jgi:hypothetical protein